MSRRSLFQQIQVKVIAKLTKQQTLDFKKV